MEEERTHDQETCPSEALNCSGSGQSACEETDRGRCWYAILFEIERQARLVIRQEEKDLEKVYGDDFRAYKARTWRFVPCVY